MGVICFFIICINQLWPELKYFTSTNLSTAKETFSYYSMEFILLTKKPKQTNHKKARKRKWHTKISKTISGQLPYHKTLFTCSSYVKNWTVKLTTNALPALKSAFLLSMSCSALSIFSCLFLLFHAIKHSRVILVTFGPKAARYQGKRVINARNSFQRLKHIGDLITLFQKLIENSSSQFPLDSYTVKHASSF